MNRKLIVYRQRLRRTFHIAQSAETIDGGISECFHHRLIGLQELNVVPVSFSRIFAVSADGFDTVGFGDEAALRAEDAGLLGWVTGCVSCVRFSGS